MLVFCVVRIEREKDLAVPRILILRVFLLTANGKIRCQSAKTASLLSDIVAIVCCKLTIVPEVLRRKLIDSPLPLASLQTSRALYLFFGSRCLLEGSKRLVSEPWLRQRSPCNEEFVADIFCTSYLAILSVYNKTGLLDLAKGLIKHNIRLLASGGTAKLIREAGFDVE